MAFVFDEQKFRVESEEFYRTYPADVSALEAELDERYRQSGGVSAMVQKKWTYEVVSRKCEVKVFRYCPFYSEIITGRERNSVAGAFPPIPGLGCWTSKTHYPVKEFDDWRAPYVEKDLIFAEMMVDYSHHYADVEAVMHRGFQSIRDEIAEKLEETVQAGHEKEKNSEEREFLEAALAACDAAILLGERFSKESGKMLEGETDAAVREQLERIRDTAKRVPRYPAETFYEALCSVWFTRELCTSMEGSGFAVMGHYDRILYPFYEKDVKEGALTKEEAQNLIDCLILITDARWSHTAETSGTNASLVIGGCDADGNVIFNEVTRLILNSFIKYETSSPKLEVRISAVHPEAYKRMVAQIAALGRNALSILNDDVLIEAHHRAGKELTDCRLYLAGGCQEPVLSNECNSRAFLYLNLPQILSGMLFPEELDFWSREHIVLKRPDNADTFEGFYENVIYNVSQFLFACAGHYNRFEQIWAEINPMPMFSATMQACIVKKMDVTRGGARYNSTSFSLTGIGTFIDSLYAIRKVVYEERKLTMAQMKELLKTDFAGQEAWRLYLQNKVPKYGQDDEEMASFAGRVFHDLAIHGSGMPNARGGYFEASLFAFFFYDVLKEHTWATADGRHAGQRISRGCNPMESTKEIDASTLMQSLRSIDFKDYPGCAVSYLEMPISKNAVETDVFVKILEAFVHCGGNALDFNVVDKETLLQAKKDPDSHRNLIVRVCGYSAPFVSLSEELQDEVIERTMRNG